MASQITMHPGSKVRVKDLKSEEGMKLNGKEGVVDHYSYFRERYAISLPGASDLKMIKEGNLDLLEAADPPPSSDKDTKPNAASAAPIFEKEAEMLDQLKAMGMPEQMLKNLTPQQKQTMFEMTQRQDIVQRARKLANVDDDKEKQPLKEGPGGVYSWRDEGETVYFEMDCTGKSNISCKIEQSAISVTSSDSEKPLLNGTLFQDIIPAVSTWNVEKNESDNTEKLVAKLKKLSTMRWLMLTR